MSSNDFLVRFKSTDSFLLAYIAIERQKKYIYHEEAFKKLHHATLSIKENYTYAPPELSDPAMTSTRPWTMMKVTFRRV
jgi:hypothetical protein